MIACSIAFSTMREFQDKRQWKRTFRSRYFILFLLVPIALIAHGVWNAYVRYERSASTVVSLEREKARLVERQRDLSRSTAALATPEGIDREIRTTYGLVKPGEELIVVVGADQVATSDSDVASRGWWDMFLDFFR